MERKHVRHAIQAALARPVQEPVTWNKPELKTLKHSDNCRYWDEDIYCTCGAIEYEELQFWKNKTLARPAQEQWNAALDEAASRIGEIKGFGQTTQDSFAVFIKGLKK